MLHPITIEAAGGEYMDSVVVVEWTVKPGERIAAGDTVVVVETAKAATEVPAPHDGYLVETFFEPGQEAPVGAMLGNIGETPDAAGPGESGGVPARPIRDRFAPAIAERFQALRWWDWDHAKLRTALDDFRNLSAEAFLEKHET